MNSAEENITCPFNVGHTFPRWKLLLHLIKCEERFPEVAEKFAKCPNNWTHRILSEDMERHLEVCENRQNSIHYELHVIGAQRRTAIQEIEKNVNVPLQICPKEPEKDWDEESDSTSANVINAVQTSVSNYENLL